LALIAASPVCRHSDAVPSAPAHPVTVAQNPVESGNIGFDPLSVIVI
jgi:hypothetical protein